jgi:hypothetical protein
MAVKSLPTFKHTSIGAKTHKARTATAHVSYIMRSQAMTKFQAENMPDGGRGTRVYFDKLWEKAGMPDNARIADKLMLALPIELNQEQRYALVAGFMRQLGQGRIAWCAAHHDAGEDAHNPHAHVVFKDADIATGRKVIGTTTNSRDVREAKENGWKVPPRTTTAEMRQRWCDHLNAFMERAGLDIRYDPRTLKQQGIDRTPQIHVGPKAEALNQKGYPFASRDYLRGERAIPYTMYDQESRARHNAEIIDANRSREQAAKERADSPHYPRPSPASHEDQEKRGLREAQDRARRILYQEQQRDRDALRQAQNAVRLGHKKWARQLYAQAREIAFQKVKERYSAKWEKLRAAGNRKQQAQAAAALKLEQKQSYARESAAQIDQSRPAKDEAWKAMQAQQEKERLALRMAHRQEMAALARQQIAERFATHEKWRAYHLDKQANRIDARLIAHQGMAAQQKTALHFLKLHARATRSAETGGPAATPATPHEAARAYLETARLEQQKLSRLRATLTAERMANSARAPLAIASRENAGGRPRRGLAAGHPMANGATPREMLAPSLHAAKQSRSAKIHERIHEADSQSQIRQAVASGRPLTGAERASAAPDIKEKLLREEHKAMARSLFTSGSAQRQQHNKGGRTGGGRGR